MEEKKLDINSIIGFLLIFGILIFWFYQNQPTPEELEAQKAQQEQQQVLEESTEPETATPLLETQAIDVADSTAVVSYKNAIGEFGFTQVSEGTTVLENEVLYLEISNKGGQVVEARMKNFVTYDSIPVYLVKDGNAIFDLNFTTTNNRVLNTRDLYFEPTLTNDGNNQVLSLKTKVSSTQFLEYRYEMKPTEYLVGFNVRSQGLNGVFNQNQPINLKWQLRGIRHNKSIQYENRYTRLTYNHEEGKISKLSETGDDEDTEIDVKWLSYRQHFFSSILTTNTHFETVDFTSKNLVTEESKEAQFTKEYTTVAPLQLEAGELSYAMNWYYGPTDIAVLKKYKELGLAESIPYGWGIFGFINKNIFTPFYGFLSSFLPFGLAIVVMTIIVRLLMSPVTYKSYLSQAKMKVLKPEITELGEKYKDNAMKKQQETMKLYNKAGVSPMSGCIPALLQLPIFYALFMFFPTSFALRQKSFLWAEDLSSYDTIAQLPFAIPFYGDHVSLFPILASVAIFFYMMMTTGQNMQTQPGMPNMKFIMYLSPLMMLFFFNNYASGLSLYYFISNLITIFIMLAIKRFILDEDKIHAQIQLNKAKPKKENKFQKKMREMMEQADQQKKKK
jgi:YidC/Oxa1 family membrane protein insertase